MNTKLRYTLPARLAIAKIAGLDPLQTRQDTGLRLPIAEGIQPFRKGFPTVGHLIPEQVEHLSNCNLYVTAGQACQGEPTRSWLETKSRPEAA